MEIDKALYSEIKAYCDINGLKPREYVHKLLKKAFMEDKYGKMPEVLIKKHKEDEMEVHVKPNKGVEIIETTVVLTKEEVSEPKPEPAIEKREIEIKSETKPVKSKKTKL